MLKIDQKYEIDSKIFTVIGIKVALSGRELYIVDMNGKLIYWDKEWTDEMIHKEEWKFIKIIKKQHLS